MACRFGILGRNMAAAMLAIVHKLSGMAIFWRLGHPAPAVCCRFYLCTVALERRAEDAPAEVWPRSPPLCLVLLMR
jgi:hypothetical protein